MLVLFVFKLGVLGKPVNSGAGIPVLAPMHASTTALAAVQRPAPIKGRAFLQGDVRRKSAERRAEKHERTSAGGTKSPFLMNVRVP